MHGSKDRVLLLHDWDYAIFVYDCGQGAVYIGLTNARCLLTAPVKQGAAPVCTRDVPRMYICMSGTAQWPELALL